ncbi:hypothetical protein [Hydrogenimonas sp.]
MNASPGRALLLVMAVAAALRAATDYSYALHLSKRSLFLKEPFTLTFEVNQTDPSKVMFFDFGIKNRDAFSIHRLDRVVDEGYHARKERYIYLLYPLKEGKLTIDFDLLVRRGNDEMLSSAFTGGRYNVKAVETDDRHEPIPPATVSVKPLPVAAALVGRFSMERSVDRKRLHAQEPLYLTVRLRGVGYLPDIERLAVLPPIDGVKIFADEPQIRTRLTKEGTEIDATFRYALIAKRDFRIPDLTIEAFDPESERAYRLQAPSVAIAVEAADASSLLDREESPQRVGSPYAAIERFFIYLSVFAAGWIGGLLAGRLRGIVGVKRKSDGWKERVASCKDARMLLKLLLEDPQRFEPWIVQLERALYTGGKIDFKRVKREVLRAC